MKAPTMFEPLIEIGTWIRSLFPTTLKKKPHFNFITLHYMYIVAMAIIVSIMIYPAGPDGVGMEYIDALFFAAGVSTQSGLNTIDINRLTTYQQVVFMLMTCVCTPIFINTFVVFVRLYWFEKRFVHVVKQSKQMRRMKSRSIHSRSKSQMREDKNEQDQARLEMGVQGKVITVDTSTARFIDRAGNDEDTDAKRKEFLQKLGPSIGLEPVDPNSTATSESSHLDSTEEGTTAGSDSTGLPTVHVDANSGQQTPIPVPEPESPQTSFMGLNPRLNRGITFADEVPQPGRQSPELVRVPEQREISRHIEFIERQQANAKKGGALYIPGPRDFDRGKLPEEMNEDQTISRLNTKTSFAGAPAMTTDGRPSGESEAPIRRGITINEPEHPGHRRERARTLVAADNEKVDQQTNKTTDDDDKSGPTSTLERMKSALNRKRSHSMNISENRKSFSKVWTNLTTAKQEEPMPYFSWTATTGRNSLFVNLTSEQREELGGIEYRSLKTLAKILLAYFIGFHTLGMTILLPWIVNSQPWRNRVIEQGQDPAWWGVFTPASLFNDLGFTITADSMLSFEDAVLPLLFGSFLVIVGNTGFPCMLRFVIWACSKVVPYGSSVWEELRFLLDHPRRCFTLLFPSKATWWLFWIVIGLNVVDLIFFIILDLNQPVVTDLPVGLRVLNGWFQATSTRTAGFSSVALAELHAAIQVSYMVMMYISVFPIAISIRRTNVYEEKSLGIFGGEEVGDGDEDEQSYVSQHLRRQLSFDLWYIFLGLFIIAIVEGDRVSNTNEYAFTMFSILFEIVSAYGTVGLSLGYPGINASFSAEFRTISKLIIIAMMIRGRHRGLPYALDRAILLPSEKLQQKEAEDAERRMTRRGSMFAEENQHKLRRKNSAWSDGELDQYGLPKQHTVEDAMTSGAGGVANPDGLHQVHARRTNTAPAQSSHKRGRSLSRVVLGGLSAGPTLSKRD